MLLAASESAVTKKPRLRQTSRRSSAVRPFGVFQSAMSRLMFTSCGIQWLAQVARYLSHAHLYLNGTSWLTSEAPLMMNLSSTRTRRLLAAASEPSRAGAACRAAAGSAARRAGGRARSCAKAGTADTSAGDTSAGDTVPVDAVSGDRWWLRSDRLSALPS